MTWLQYAIVAAVACITTMALVQPVKRLAFKIDAVDYPSERRVNKQPTARFGGVAMFGGLLCGLLPGNFRGYNACVPRWRSRRHIRLTPHA